MNGRIMCNLLPRAPNKEGFGVPADAEVGGAYQAYDKVRAKLVGTSKQRKEAQEDPNHFYVPKPEDVPEELRGGGA